MTCKDTPLIINCKEKIKKNAIGYESANCNHDLGTLARA